MQRLTTDPRSFVRVQPYCNVNGAPREVYRESDFSRIASRDGPAAHVERQHGLALVAAAFALQFAALLVGLKG
jgi:hypothetical protein